MTFTHERCDGNAMSNSFLDIITLNLRLSSLLKYRTCLDAEYPFIGNSQFESRPNLRSLGAICTNIDLIALH